MNNTEKLSIGNRFKKLGESINAQVWEIFHWQKYDLDVKGWIAIKTIKSGGNINVQLLAEILHISHPAVVQLFNQLSKSGYVRSGKSDRDKRNTFLNKYLMRDIFDLISFNINRINFPDFFSIFSNRTIA